LEIRKPHRRTAAAPLTPSRSFSRTSAPSGTSFSEQELGALKSKDELVTEIVAKYSIDKAQAQRDVDIVMKGRQI
jgi:hypothetical protein